MARYLVITTAMLALLAADLVLAQPPERGRPGGEGRPGPGARPSPPGGAGPNRPNRPPTMRPTPLPRPERPGRPKPPEDHRPRPPKPGRPLPGRPQPPAHRPGIGRPPNFRPIHRPGFRYPRGYAYRRWSVGLLLPSLFLSSTYYFNDYAALGVGPPPPGCRWVRYGPDLLLVERGSGRIRDVIYGAFY